MNSATTTQQTSADELLAKIADELTERLNRGEEPEIEAYAQRYPEIAALIRQMLPALKLVRLPGQGDSEDGNLGMGALGDFLILREVGRGGMGVVYEAQQISLRRRVALKVLPFASTLDAKQLQRFKNEAQAAAHLHHQNIVPVFATGCERGVHYYAMQFIEGQSLADTIAELRLQNEAPRSARVSDPAASPDLKRQADVAAPKADSPSGAEGGLGPAGETATQARLSTLHSMHGRAFYQAIARLGIQAAEALDYSHELGIIHRDVKPANMLIDGQGKLWIADFGLAHCQSQAGLTMTGDLVGTLRYMSPEQALAKRVIVDHRTDIYSLGATLYELLTGEPVFDGADRQELLRQVAFEEPKTLKRHNKAIPAELETIVLKALEKNPAERYGSAREMADDLQRYLQDQPIRARRPSLVLRARKWGRRHQGVVTTALLALVLALLVMAGSIGWATRGRVNRQSQLDIATTALLDEVASRRKEIHDKLADPIKVCELVSKIDGWHDSLAKARAAWESANSLAATNEDVLTAELAERLRQMSEKLQSDEADWKTAKNLDDIRLEAASSDGATWDLNASAPKYERFFEDLGFDWKTSRPAQIAAKIQQANLRYVLVGALDDWARTSTTGRAQHLETARLVDPDRWRDQVRNEKNWVDLPVLERLAREAEPAKQSPQILRLLAGKLDNQKGDARALLRSALMYYPQDFWLHVTLGNVLKDPDQRIYCFQAALAVRPTSPVANTNLGVALDDKKDLDGAFRHYQKALEVDPKFVPAHINLGIAMGYKEDPDSAIRHFRKAIDLDPNDADAQNRFGIALIDKNDLDGAIRHFCKAIDLDSKSARAHYNLGLALSGKNDLDGAIRHYKKTIELHPNYADAHNNLGTALMGKKDLDGAIRHFQKAIDLLPKHAFAHSNLAIAFMSKKDLDGAIRHLQKALEVNPKLPAVRYTLGNLLRDKKDLDGAIRQYEKAIEADPKSTKAHINLGAALIDKKDLDGAIRHSQKAIDLDPNSAFAHNNLGAALKDKKDLDGAIRHFQKAIDLDPKFAVAYYGLGDVLMAKKDLDGAIRHFQKAIEVDPKQTKAHLNLGNALGAKNDLDGAIRHFQKAIEADPKFAAAHFNLGLALSHKKDFDGAIRHYQNAIEVDPKFVWAHLNLGNLLRDKKDLDGAIRHFQKAIDLDPKFILAHCALGDALRDQKDFDGAIRQYEKALEVDANFPNAHCGLGLALRDVAQFSEALKHLQRCHELGVKSGWSYPSAQWVQHCERLVKLDQQVPAVLKGEVVPASPLLLTSLQGQKCWVFQDFLIYLGYTPKKKVY